MSGFHKPNLVFLNFWLLRDLSPPLIHNFKRPFSIGGNVVLKLTLKCAEIDLSVNTDF